jgi:hypothetical protein
MQISRHWRLKNQRYRMQGLRNNNTNTNAQVAPATSINGNNEREANTDKAVRIPATAGR